ncbi:hypothetical protein NCAS_0I00510 [Naumovozyma castellii]|uniref:Uncharacterized protein n=1 Tax=Naumovozyma castellii TaxID=27288 RepID=G0VJN9_NAUCA|nr:hypothetical protein NCAS_0I00510 [Naumovozyma castellii CBS 4309]CCC71719.1 hypothetical protein NCAS_0I00510 [Naumovozyma castellii CBS 4309]
MQNSTTKLRNEFFGLTSNSPAISTSSNDFRQAPYHSSNLNHQQPPLLQMDDPITRDVRSKLDSMKSFEDDDVFYPDPMLLNVRYLPQANPYLLQSDQTSPYVPNGNLFIPSDDLNINSTTSNNNIPMNSYTNNNDGIYSKHDSHRENLLSALAHKNIEKQQQQLRLQQQTQEQQHNLHKQFAGQQFHDRRMVNQKFSNPSLPNRSFNMHQHIPNYNIPK